MLNCDQRVDDASAHYQRLVRTHTDRAVLELHVDRAVQDHVHLIARFVKMWPRIAELVIDPPMQNLDTRRPETVRRRRIGPDTTVNASPRLILLTRSIAVVSHRD